MPPKARITAGMIVEAAFAIVRESGAENLNARAIAQKLDCSTQPVLYQFATVEDVRKAAYAYADQYHSRYILKGLEESPMPLRTLGMNYIRFAATEQHLFRFLFQSAGLSGGNLLSLMDDPGLAPMMTLIQQAMNVSPDAARRIFTQLFLTAHGYASLLANNPMPFNETEASALLEDVFSGACAAEAINEANNKEN